MGVAAEKSRPGAGEKDLEAAALQAKGNLGVNYELARILGEVGMYQRAHSRQMECHRTLLEKGYTRIPDLAKLELWKVRETIRQGKFQVARQGMEFAKRLDPFCPWVPYQNLLLHFAERSPLGWDLGFVWTSVGEILELIFGHRVDHLFGSALQCGLAEQHAIIGEDRDWHAPDVRKPADEGGAVERLELVELAAVDQPRDDFVDVIGRADVVGDDAVEFVGVVGGGARVP